MVYPREKDEAVREYMAMGPERSNPLHNFTLPYLKWGNQRYLRCMKVDSAAGAASGADHRLRRRSSPSRFGDSSGSIATGGGENKQLRQQPELRSQHHRLGSTPSGSSGADGGEEGIDEVREKIMLDLRKVVDKMKKSILSEGASDDEDEEEQTGRENEKGKQIEKPTEKEKEKEKEKGREEPLAVAEEVRPWNLRTRRGAASKAPMGDAGNGFLNTSGYDNRGLRIEEKRTRNDAMKSPAVAAATDRPKFSVSLTKKEIEEDFMAMVGRRPPRRSKKRPRNVQKQMDTLFPGLWLTEVTPDWYKVPDSAENKKS